MILHKIGERFTVFVITIHIVSEPRVQFQPDIYIPNLLSLAFGETNTQNYSHEVFGFLEVA